MTFRSWDDRKLRVFPDAGPPHPDGPGALSRKADKKSALKTRNEAICVVRRWPNGVLELPLLDWHSGPPEAMLLS